MQGWQNDRKQTSLHWPIETLYMDSAGLNGIQRLQNYLCYIIYL